MNKQVITQAKPIAAKPALNSTLQRTAITPVAHGILQRCSNGVECAECREKREQREGTLQRAAVNAAPASAVPPIVHDVLNSPGQPLDAGTRSFMEPRFGHDFSGVRVHTDAKAAESAKSVNALAYTVGRNVVFGAGQYIPGTMAGRRLLAHELTHTIQQSQGYAIGIAAKSALQVNQPGDSHEQEADRTADSVVYGSLALPHVSVSSTTMSATLQRAPANNPSKRGFQGVKRTTDGGIMIYEVWQQNDTLESWRQRTIRDYFSWRFGAIPTERLHRMLAYILSLDHYSTITSIVGETYLLSIQKETEITLIQLSGQRQTPPSSASGTGDAKDITPGTGDTQGAATEVPKKTVTDTGGAKGTATEDKTKGPGDAAQQEEIPPEVRDFYKNAAVAPAQQISTDELMRMYYLFTRFVKGNPKWVQQGQSFKDWVDFLDKNAKQLRGKLEATETGKLQLDTLKRLTEKLDKGQVLELPDQEEKELSEKARQAKLKEGISLTSGSPEWLLIPIEDRKLLLEVMQKHPELFSDTVTGEDTPKKLTVGAKRAIALRISANYFPGEVGKSLLNMAQDPSFWLTTAGIIAIYVGLWLAPEPFTKVAAAALTAYLLTRVSIDIILAFARAWSRLNDSCENDAKTGAEIENIAKRFAADLGPAGATVLIMIATWALGKAVQSVAPKGGPIAEGGDVPPEASPVRPSGPPKLEVIKGGKGSSAAQSSTVRSSGTSGTTSSSRGGSSAAQALKVEPVTEPVPRTYPQEVPKPVEQPAVQPESQPTTAQAAGQTKPGPLSPTQAAAATGTAAQTATKEEEEKKKKKRYPLCWPNPLILPPPQFPRGVLWQTFVRIKGADRDEEEAAQQRMQLRWRQFRDPDFDPGKYHVHHVVPLFLGGPDDLYGNGVTWYKNIHLKGHAQLRQQPQMADPQQVKPLPPLPKDMYSHPDGTLYELVGTKSEGECPP